MINFLPGKASKVGDPVLAHPDFAGIHFTGSTPVFQSMWKTIGDNIAEYRSYPRIVGETGGKNFVFAHPSADVDAYVDGAGARRLRVPGAEVLGGLAGLRAEAPLAARCRSGWSTRSKSIDMGPTADFRNFMAAVIDEPSFDRIMGYIDHAKGSSRRRDPGRRQRRQVRGLLHRAHRGATPPTRASS